jgi:hypothetical protein
MMAIRDDWRESMRNQTGDNRSTIVAVVIGAIVALLLATWLFIGGPNNDSGMTRTSAPTTNQPDTNKGGTTKQP